MKLFQVRAGKILTLPTGEMVCTGGERVPADHPAVKALPDADMVGFLVDDGTTETTEVRRAEPETPAASNAQPTAEKRPWRSG